MKIVFILAFALILGSLAFALFFMLRRKSGKSMVWSLTARVALSITLFVCVLLAHWMGWIQPTGLR
ncbi:twin transmembrane helix small protein [Massilia sp. W12]|uniref:twin transmembrane helix small protein n=1 Tax=Massilia sp. W12 TaxID=3126507 RepID=UPI0030D47353